METSNQERERYILDSVMNKYMRIIKWLVIIIVILVLSLIGTNLAWVIYENQFVDYEETVTQETEDGDNNYIGEDGIIINK